MIQTANATVHLGNNLDILPTLPDNSVDSIVTDPPYELGFMGKKWDSTGIAYSTELWGECLRVLKPGGHLLAFGGTRTWHRIAVAIEDSGFEVRDSIAWMYATGFPKSLDVSKAIDKRGGKVADFTEFRDAVKAAMKEKKITTKALQIALGNQMTSHYLTAGSQPAVPNWRDYQIIRDTVGLGSQFDELFMPEAEREVVGQKSWSNSANHFIPGENHSERVNLDITTAATEEAKKWEGWGTALKPAFEPVIVARKPLIGTVAENVLTHGTGALNIDGSRIGTEVLPPHKSGSNALMGGLSGTANQGGYETPERIGRWPANVILDEYTAELLDEQSGVTGGGKPRIGIARTRNNGIGLGYLDKREGSANSPDNYGDTGGASRFFYVAKASKRDRNEGLEELPSRRASAMGYDIGLGEAGEGMFKDRNPIKQNFHPTVKPTDLMRYLVKLVTPPGGTVLDPFTGSGSTGKAAILEGFKFIGCEMTEDYFPIIEGRLKHAEQTKLTAEKEKEGELF